MRRWLPVLPLAAGAFLLDPFVAQLRAQPSQTELGSLATRIDQVERDLKDVQRTIYGARRPSGITGQTSNLDAATAGTLMTRVDELEGEIRQLTGQVEELGYRLNQLNAQFQKYVASTGGAPAAQAPQNPPAPAAQGSAQAPDDPQEGTPASGNSADSGGGLAPGPTSLGKIPANSVPPQPQGTYQDQYNTAIGYLRQQDYPRAEAALKRFLADHGETDLAGPAMYWLGEVYFVQGKYTDAAQTFLDSLRKYPQSSKAPDSMLKLGMSLAQLKQVKEACLAFKDLPRKYPNASQTIQQRAKVESQRAGCK